MTIELTDKQNINIIRRYCEEQKFKRPIVIKPVGQWIDGKVYACTSGLFGTKRYAFYMHEGKIISVRER